MNPNYFISSLAQTLTIGGNDTQIALSTIYTQDGQIVTTADFATFGRGIFTINPSSLSNVEFASFTTVNPAIGSNGGVSGVLRGLSFKGNNQIPANQKFNVIGTPVIISFGTHNISDIKKYIDSIAIAGAPDATVTTKGIVKVSVAPVLSTNPIAVGDNDPRIPNAGQQAALAGSQGVPSATNKFVTSDNIYDSDTDQTQTTQNGTIEFGMANTTGNKNKTQQSFIPLKTKTRGVKLYKSADTGTFTGTVTIALYADTAGSPSGSALATVTFTNSAWILLPVGEFEADFSAEYSMTAGTLYWIQASSSTSDNSNHPNLGTNNAGGYANGSVKYWNTTNGYVLIATIALYFKTLQGINNQDIITGPDGKLPALFYDVTKMPIPAFPQSLAVGNIGNSTSYSYFGMGSNQDGSVLYRSDLGLFVRMVRDNITGQYVETHRISASGSVGVSWSIVQVGNYIYCFKDYSGGSPYYVACTRYLASDLTGATAMTIPNISSGGPFSSQLAWTDGISIYVLGNSTTVYKLSISGSTFTQIGTGTTTLPQGGISMFDGNNIYVVITNTGTGTFKIYKANDAYFSSPTITYINVGSGWNGAIDYSSIIYITNIDTKRMYVGLHSSYAGPTTGSTYRMNLFPVSKP